MSFLRLSIKTVIDENLVVLTRIETVHIVNFKAVDLQGLGFRGILVFPISRRWLKSSEDRSLYQLFSQKVVRICNSVNMPTYIFICIINYARS